MKSILILALVLLTFGIGAAQIPHTLSYQGYYTNNGGQPITGTYPMAFKLYTQPNGGSPTWTQTFANVPVTKGVYSVVLDVSAVTFDRQYWLETVINGVTSSSRTQLTGVPYSLAPWTPSDSNVYFTGGNAGIGTNTPTARLDVRGNLTLDAGSSPVLFTGTASSELSRYLNLINSPTSPSASGLKAGGILVSDSYSYANPGKNDLIVKGNVGIGTSSPDQKVTVWAPMGFVPGDGSFIHLVAENGSICCPSPKQELLVGADVYGGVVSTMSNDDLQLRAGGNSTKMLIKANGNIGIGTSSPQAGMDINRFPNIRLRDFYGGGFFDIYATGGGLNLGGPLNIYQGNVGVNTATPTATLDVAGRTKTQVLEITGGSDMAEPFETTGGIKLDAGTVMVIDAAHPGKLKASGQAYDKKVAGVVSGAAGVKAGLTLRQRGVMEGNSLIAIAGRVYCKAEALSTPIEPGDLLTTSNLLGYAMKAADSRRSHGAVFGKAMSSLRSGKGLVLVLVNLQ
jgi:hypothetical protein